MAPAERSSTPVSTTSEESQESQESQPVAKRRRIETLTNPKTVNAMRSSAVTQKTSSENIPGLKTVDGQEQQAVVPSYENLPTVHVDSQPVQSFKEPYSTIVTIECGNQRNVHYQVDLALICAESEKQLQLFTNAQQLHGQYRAVKDLRKQARAFRSLLMSRGILKMNNSREKATKVIEEALLNFPIPKYQKTVKTTFIDVVDILFYDHEMFLLPPTKAKKFDRSTFPKEDVMRRLKELKTEALFAVIERLNQFMESMKTDEPKLYVKDPLKAAAHRRILLPDADPKVVQIVIQWLHKDGLPDANTEQLLHVHTVADRLGISRLTSLCMDLLSSSVSHVINEAKRRGITLTDLLEQRHSEPNHEAMTEELFSNCNVVKAVFKFTLLSQHPPVALQTLVVNAIVDSEDDHIMETLLDSMNIEMRGMLAKASMRKAKLNGMAARKMEQDRPQAHSSSAGGVKSGESPACSPHSNGSSIKSEISDVKYDWDPAILIAGSKMARGLQYAKRGNSREERLSDGIL